MPECFFRSQTSYEYMYAMSQQIHILILSHWKLKFFNKNRCSYKKPCHVICRSKNTALYNLKLIAVYLILVWISAMPFIQTISHFHCGNITFEGNNSELKLVQCLHFAEDFEKWFISSSVCFFFFWNNIF